MCRSYAQGGRRCPSCRGDSRRAYQRGRYHALKTEGEFKSSFTATTAPSASDVESMSRAERIQAAQDARTRARSKQGAVADSYFENMEKSVKERLGQDSVFTTRKHYIGSSAWMLATDEARADYEAKVRDLGGDLAIAVHANYLNRLEDEGLTLAAYQAAEEAWVRPENDPYSTFMNAHGRFYFERRVEQYRQAVLEELRAMNDFDQSWQVENSNAALTKKNKDTFAAMSTMFPSELVECARDRYDDLVVKHSRARAFFAENKFVEWESRKRDDDVRIEEFGSGVQFSCGGGGGEPQLFDDTEENEEKYSRLVEDHNEGRTEYYIPGKRTRYGGSSRTKLVLKRVKDKDGQTKLAIRRASKKSVSISGYAPLLTTDGSESTTLHELAHTMEFDSRVALACKQFLTRRTQGCEQKIYYQTSRTTEYTRADSFISEYIGKDYTGKPNTEVFSMGMEGVILADARGAYTGMVKTIDFDYDNQGKATGESLPDVIDNEHRDLILGLLASIGKDTQER